MEERYFCKVLTSETNFSNNSKENTSYTIEDKKLGEKYGVSFLSFQLYLSILNFYFWGWYKKKKEHKHSRENKQVFLTIKSHFIPKGDDFLLYLIKGIWENGINH